MTEIARMVRLTYGDTSPLGYLEGLYRNSRSACLSEDEAGRIFSSRLVEDLGLMNKLWDGRTVTVDRVNRSFQVTSPRSTISWMVQPHVFSKFMERKGDEARGIGFLARCLVSFPVSTQGTRFIRTNPASLKGIEAFRNRVSSLLNDQIELLQPREDGNV